MTGQIFAQQLEDGVYFSNKYSTANVNGNELFNEYKISFESHLKNFDGLPTVEKLKKLNKKGVLNKSKNNKVKKLKKLFTSKILKKEEDVGYIR